MKKEIIGENVGTFITRVRSGFAAVALKFDDSSHPRVASPLKSISSSRLKCKHPSPHPPHPD